MRVYKYPLPMSAVEIPLAVPIGAQVLAVQVQRDVPCIWMLVDPGAALEKRTFVIVGTGHDILGNPAQLSHHGTFQVDGGNFVYHVFEVG